MFNLKFRFAMQMKRVFFISLFVLSLVSLKAQIKINELNVSNKLKIDGLVPSGTPDYVELYNAGTTAQSFSNNVYYLSDDKTNLFKWKIPTSITLAANGFITFWLDGKDVKEPGAAGRYHTNFDIMQCKNPWNQWLMLVRNNGVIADSVLIRPTKIGDTWGRYPDGSPKWRLLNNGVAFGLDLPNTSNPVGNVYYGYAPTPTFSYTPGWPVLTSGNYTMVNPDTVNYVLLYTQSDCTNPHGKAPCLTYTGCPTATPPTLIYIDDILTPITPGGMTTMIRAILLPKPSNTSYTMVGTPAYTSYSTNISQLYLPSFVETNTYFEGLDVVTSPGFGVLSVCSPTAGFPTAASNTIHVEYFDKNMMFSEGYATQSKPINEPSTHEQRSFDVALDDETGFGCAVFGKVFNDATLGVSSRTVMTNFGVRAAGVDNFTQPTPTVGTIPSGAHMRDAFVQTYAMTNNLNLDGLHYKPVRGFVNGCYMGVYEFRELANKDYVNYYYKHHKDSIDILQQYAGQFISAGTDTAWFKPPPLPTTYTTGVFNQIQIFYGVMNTATFYQRILKRLDQKSFMDFMIYNSYLVNADLMSLNNSWWRGFTPSVLKTDSSSSKWRYFMWDMNNVLDLNANPRTLAVTNMSVSPCVYTASLSPVGSYTTAASSYTGHGFILKTLLRNPVFKNDYLNRYMDLLNTTLRCDKMLAHLQYFRNMFTPEMNNHVISLLPPWATINYADWDANMDTLRARITTRCVNTASLLAKSTCENFVGPYNIDIDVKPVGAGTVDFNSLHLTNFIWSGTYYQNRVAPYLLSYLKATPIDTNKYVFDHWEWTACCTNSTTATPNTKVHIDMLGADSISFVITSGDHITAVFADKRTDVVVPTGFTPNGDGVNDVLLPLGASARYSRDYEFQVWNRWGQEVFRTADTNQGWDGTFDGGQAQTGVYAYLVKYKNVLNEVKFIKGNVTLIR